VPILAFLVQRQVASARRSNLEITEIADVYFSTVFAYAVDNRFSSPLLL
jgi:hypothetical protein